MKYQGRYETWQATAKTVQPCIFLTKSHECTVNCVISSRNFSNHYIIWDHLQLIYMKTTGKFLWFIVNWKTSMFLKFRAHSFAVTNAPCLTIIQPPSTVISHQTSIGSILCHWRYNPATDLNVKMLIQWIRLVQPVQRCSMPQWNLHLVLMSLLKPPFASEGSLPTDNLRTLDWSGRC